MTESADTNLRDELGVALSALAAARDAVAEARDAATEARDAVHLILNRLAASRSGDGGIDAALVRALYWEHPEVHVERIGRAAGLRTGDVHRFAGQTFTVNVGCVDCGERVPITMSSRTAVAQRNAGNRGFALCDPCAARRQERRAEALREWEAERDEEDQAEADWWRRHVSSAALEEAERRGIQLR